jgi:hypothetical protein
MQQHPFTISTFYKAVGIAVIVLATAVFAALFVLYGSATFFVALFDSLVYMCSMAVCAYVYWYVAPFLQVFQAKIAVALLVQVVCLGMTFLLLLGFESSELFGGRIFLHLVYGFLCWIIVMQWYSGFQKSRQAVEMEEVFEPVEVKDAINHVSVKEGNEIHIVPVEDLLYIQAYGDYVMLFTNTGKHLKEQTMKYFELHLPSSFVRVHRSHIVNTSQIIRVELFGKENYSVRLKNGVCLRASSAGYRLLKERLSL